MEFHGTWSAPISLTQAVPWNSMAFGVCQFRWHEQFLGIPWHLVCDNFTDSSNSMEFRMRPFWWHEQFHGIPWNWECGNFDDTSSSMEFHGIPWNLMFANYADTSSYMKLHGTWSAPISLTRAVPWNSMELRMRQLRWHEQFHVILWNLRWANFADTSSSTEFHGIP